MWYLSNFFLRFYRLQLPLAHSGIPVSEGTPVKRLMVACFPGYSEQNVPDPVSAGMEETPEVAGSRVPFPRPDFLCDGKAGGPRRKRI